MEKFLAYLQNIDWDYYIYRNSSSNIIRPHIYTERTVPLS